MVFQLVDAALLELGELLPHQQFGHRAAAGVAGADEQDHRAGQSLERAFGDDAFAEDLEVIVVDPHDATRAAHSGRVHRRESAPHRRPRTCGLPRP